MLSRRSVALPIALFFGAALCATLTAGIILAHQPTIMNIYQETELLKEQKWDYEKHDLPSARVRHPVLVSEAWWVRPKTEWAKALESWPEDKRKAFPRGVADMEAAYKKMVREARESVADIMNISEEELCRPGGANCCVDEPEACLDDDAAVERIEALRSIGVRTIVMGIPGVDIYADTMDRLAEAGGLPNTRGPRRFYSVSAAGGTEELTATLESIAGRLLRTCEVVLNAPPPPDRTLNVAVECTVIPQMDPGGSEGWWLDDSDLPLRIVLEGEACDQIRNTPHARVAVLTGCPTLEEEDRE